MDRKELLRKPFLLSTWPARKAGRLIIDTACRATELMYDPENMVSRLKAEEPENKLKHAEAGLHKASMLIESEYSEPIPSIVKPEDFKIIQSCEVIKVSVWILLNKINTGNKMVAEELNKIQTMMNNLPEGAKLDNLGFDGNVMAILNDLLPDLCTKVEPGTV